MAEITGEAAATAALPAEAAVIREAVAVPAAVPGEAVAVEDLAAAVLLAGIRPEARRAAGKRVEAEQWQQRGAAFRLRKAAVLLAAVLVSIRTLDALPSYRPLYCVVS
jgi:hypothetical protein